MPTPPRRKRTKGSSGSGFDTPPGWVLPELAKGFGWDRIADPDTTGVFLSGPEVSQPEYSFGDFLSRARREVMAGSIEPDSIRRSEVSGALNESEGVQDAGRAPYLHEVAAAMKAEGIPEDDVWAERRAMFGNKRTEGVKTQAQLAEVREAWDQTDTEYKEWLAKREAKEQEQ